MHLQPPSPDCRKSFPAQVTPLVPTPSRWPTWPGVGFCQPRCWLWLSSTNTCHGRTPKVQHRLMLFSSHPAKSSSSPVVWESLIDHYFVLRKAQLVASPATEVHLSLVSPRNNDHDASRTLFFLCFRSHAFEQRGLCS